MLETRESDGMKTGTYDSRAVSKVLDRLQLSGFIVYWSSRSCSQTSTPQFRHAYLSNEDAGSDSKEDNTCEAFV